MRGGGNPLATPLRGASSRMSGEDVWLLSVGSDRVELCLNRRAGAKSLWGDMGTTLDPNTLTGNLGTAFFSHLAKMRRIGTSSCTSPCVTLDLPPTPLANVTENWARILMNAWFPSPFPRNEPPSAQYWPCTRRTAAAPQRAPPPSGELHKADHTPTRRHHSARGGTRLIRVAALGRGNSGSQHSTSTRKCNRQAPASLIAGRRPLGIHGSLQQLTHLHMRALMTCLTAMASERTPGTETYRASGLELPVFI